MCTRSDTGTDTAETYEDAVRQYLRAHDEVASKEALRAGTDVPAWYIDQIGAMTALNWNSRHRSHWIVIGPITLLPSPWKPVLGRENAQELTTDSIET
jgi:hypothetical protein